MANPFVHFEIPSDDRTRAKAFYGALFGWALQDIDGMEYTLVDAGDGGPKGGIIKRGDDVGGILNYIEVSDVAEYVNRAHKLGGEVVRSRSPIPSIGWYAILRDTEGNTFALWQDDPNAGF